ncbi:5-formyltetrahydrofolate cyclo-ligase [Toxoplasma gondii CAST]|uniref:5-formyltetrahydrofolate cyclo-ligase n=1 Tax=Toxoplasma gondii CAST TaxID=943122 RepID=A0A425HTC5_TOXGO|nr:5-formyltetrahydrofolate cyclo-ligase [Toxoplasma gondii CAST]
MFSWAALRTSTAFTLHSPQGVCFLLYERARFLPLAVAFSPPTDVSRSGCPLSFSFVATMAFSAKAVLGASLSVREAKRALRQVLLNRRNSLHRARLVRAQSRTRLAQVCESEKENGRNCMQAPDAVSDLHASETMGKRSAGASAASPCVNAEGGDRGRDTSQRGRSGEEEGVLVSRGLSEFVEKRVGAGPVSPFLSAVSPSFGVPAASSFSPLPEFPNCMRAGGMGAVSPDRDTDMQFAKEEQGEEGEERRRKMRGRFQDLLGAVYPQIVHLDGQLRAGKRPLVVSGYSPIGSELDSTFLLSLAESLGHACALPCIEEKRAPLTFRQWFCGMPLVPGKFNIPVPQPDCRHPVVEPDVVLVPLLGFDRLGRRLGYGGGYYDRTLCELRRRRGTHGSPRRMNERDSFGPVGPLSERLLAAQPPRYATVPLLVCGVAFDCQEVDEIPTEGFDQPLDCVLLENDLKLFSPELADKFQ